MVKWIRRNQIANSVAAQSACNNEVEGPRSDISKARPALVNQRISAHRTSPVHTRIHYHLNSRILYILYILYPAYITSKSRAHSTGIHPIIQRADPTVIIE